MASSRPFQEEARQSVAGGQQCIMASCVGTVGGLAELEDPEWRLALQSCSKDGEFNQQYARGKKLGTGAFSKVYWVEKKGRAVTESPAVFAAKQCIATEPDDSMQFATELYIHRRVQGHPNIIQLFDVFVTFGSAEHLPVSGITFVTELGLHSLQDHLELVCAASDDEIIHWMRGAFAANFTHSRARH